MRLEAGAPLGRYTVEALLGEGGMGEVYRAFDTLLRRRVALKVLRIPRNVEAAVPTRALSKILREARVAAALQHPNAVAIFDLGEHDGLHFLAMELVVGRPLRSFVGRPEVPLAQRVRWLADIGRALDAAHKARIVHLDIKPENVLVTADAIVKVLDFGIARRIVFDQEPQTSSTTIHSQSNALTGTPLYMAPEQVQEGELDGRTDQFSWGVLAYELLSGKMPWRDGQSLFDIFFAIVHEAPPSLKRLNADVPDALEGVILRALSKPPAERFPTMGELLVALEQAFPQIASSPSWSQPDLPAVDTPEQNTKTDPDGSDPRAFAETVPELSSQPPSDPLHATGDNAPPQEASQTSMLEVVPAPPSERSPESAPATKRAAFNSAEASSAEAPRQATRAGATRLFKLGLPLLGGLLALSFGARALLAPRVVAPAPSASTSAPVVPTAITDLPPPKRCNPAATTEVLSGMQMIRDGDWHEAHTSFERAVKADPTCAAAHLQLSLTGHTYYATTQVREVYQRAVQLRASLSERDQLFLDALDLLVRRDPSDRRAFQERILALSRRFPGDAQLVELSGEYTDDTEARLAFAKAAIALDPHYSDAYQIIASAFMDKRELDAALAALDECIRAAPSSVDCVHQRLDLDRTRGRCDDMAADARVWITRAPRSSRAYLGLARALAAQGAPTEAIEEALRQRWARLEEPERAQLEPLEQAQLDALLGRFERAEAKAREAARRVEANPSYEPHVLPMLLLAGVALETDRADRVAPLAADFLGRKAAWSASEKRGRVDVLVFHLEPLLLDARLRAKSLDERAWREARADWVASTRHAGTMGPGTLWALGEAMPVRSSTEAALALTTMPAPVRSSHGDINAPSAVRAFIGRALLLAGELDEAILFLRRAVMHCDALDTPFEDTQANLWLGQALEKKGDAKGACAVYQIVERRWGSAAPPSRTAAIAKERIQSLKCGR
jgi:eukaryotic-like serine/threonine-protein kinase